MSTRELIIDAWTALDFKRLFAKNRIGQSTQGPSLVPNWVGPHHLRRLQAYTLLRAYRENSSRFFLDFDEATAANANMRDDHREYGDAELLVQQVRAALIGDEFRITLPGANETDPADVDPTALARQDFLRDWADSQRFGLKLLDTELDAVGLGDGVYVMTWNARHRRPRLRTFDPGFYFPVYTDDLDDDEFPDTVHLAWELTPEDSPPGKKIIRRITYRLSPVTPWRPKYAGPDDPPALFECLMTDATFEVDAFRADVEDLSIASARYRVTRDITGQTVEVNDLPLGIDFVPVVHVPNTVNLKDHFGKSAITSVLQILDDLSNADTDLQAASSTAGSPVLALQGSSLGNQTKVYGPGTVFETGDGKMSVLDTTNGVAAIIKYVEYLLDRLSTNSRVPASVLGRVDPAKIRAGVILQMTFGPLTTLIEEMRLVRAEKYPLLLKFAQRYFVENGILSDVMDADVTFGSYLPTDKEQAVRNVVALLGAKAISLVTANKMLIEAGIPVADAATELARIVEEAQQITIAVTPPELQDPNADPNQEDSNGGDQQGT